MANLKITELTAMTDPVGADVLPLVDDPAGTPVTKKVTRGDFLTKEGSVSVKRTLVLTAAGGAPTTTSGCASPAKVEAGTNDVDYYTLDFDATAQEYAFWNVVMPDSYDGSTVTAQFVWTAAGGSAGNTAQWGIAARAFGDDDAIDQAYGTAQEVSDDWIANGDIHISAATSAVTIAGTPAGGKLVVFRVYRDPADANDDLAGDARLLAVKIEYGINSYSD